MGNLIELFKRRMDAHIHHYDHKKYWRMREVVLDACKTRYPYPFNTLLRLIYLYRIRKMDAANGAQIALSLGSGTIFATPPKLNHRILGIITGFNVKVGKNSTINHHVTIMEGAGVEIGDNCYIGACAKIVPNKQIRIGDNVKIGANAVVVTDVPDNCTVVGIPARIVKRSQ